MVSVNVLWLVVGGLVLVVTAVVSALRWNGRSTRGQHAFYAKEMSVGVLGARSQRSVRSHQPAWPKTDRDEVLARRSSKPPDIGTPLEDTVMSTVPHTCLNINIYNDCEMSYEIESSEVIEFTFGTLQDGFDARIERAALRRLADLAEEALRAPIESSREYAVLQASEAAV